MARIAARDAVLQMLFAKTFGTGGAVDDLPISLDSERAAYGMETLDADDRIYISDVTAGCVRMQEDIDDKIAGNLRGWDIDRLARVDLCILRLAIYEILCREDIPASVSISEAVELAHIYSTDEAPAFINGVLGAIVREIDAP